MTSNGQVRVSNASDVEVIGAILGGDERAFNVLVRRYEHHLLHFVARMTGDQQVAEDLVQETFFRVYRNLDQFDTSRSFSAWVYAIASNLGKNEIRIRNNRPIVLFQAIDEAKDIFGFRSSSVEFGDERMRPDRLFELREMRSLVEEAILHITIPRREVFVLREVEGKDYLEIAKAIEAPLGTVKSRLFRAREEFKDFIRPYLH